MDNVGEVKEEFKELSDACKKAEADHQLLLAYALTDTSETRAIVLRFIQGTPFHANRCLVALHLLLNIKNVLQLELLKLLVTDCLTNIQNADPCRPRRQVCPGGCHCCENLRCVRENKGNLLCRGCNMYLEKSAYTSMALQPTGLNDHCKGCSILAERAEELLE